MDVKKKIKQTYYLKVRITASVCSYRLGSCETLNTHGIL